MATIVVPGAGPGGIPTAYEVRSKPGSSHRVVMVDSSEFYEFTPSNPWVAVGGRRLEQTRVDMRAPFEPKGIGFIPELATHIDASGRRLTLDSGRVVEYDYLVIATGPRLAFEEVPGLGDWLRDGDCPRRGLSPPRGACAGGLAPRAQHWVMLRP